jgi:Putative peptidoglycan binding domain
MNLKKFILLSCAVPCVFAASTATAQMMGHHASIARAAPMQRAPVSTSRSGFHRFNDGDFDRDDGFRHKRTFIFIDTFGFPFFSPFFTPFPYYGYYPYPYYPYGYYPYASYGYGSYGGYGYGYGGRSEIIAAQRRLARAGYYHGAIDGILGPQTRRAIRAYERDHNLSRYGAIDRRLLSES